jgi:acyl transferase domain-containing protein
LADVAFTLAVGRSGFRFRRALICRSAKEAILALNAPVVGVNEPQALVFVFHAVVRGAEQRAAELAGSEPAFGVHFEACRAAGALTRGPEGAAFAYQYALARLWQQWGLEPLFVVGRGCGELAAAAAVGAVSLSAALDRLGCDSPGFDPRAGRCRVERWAEGGPEPSLSAVRLEVATEAPLSGLQRAWLAGASVDWSRYYAGKKTRRLPLPTYPFERQRYWMEAPSGAVDVGQVPVRDGQAYVVRAASEQLALALIEHLALRAKVHLVLAGEGALSGAARARLNAIRSTGTFVRYAYVRPQTLADDLHGIAARLRDEHLELTAVIDSAELLQDQWASKRSESELAVIAPALLSVLWPSAIARARELSATSPRKAESVAPPSTVRERQGQRDWSVSQQAK